MGTYQAVVGDVDVIIAIESDGNYCIYKPNDSVIQKGKYTEKGNVLTLDGNAKDIMYHSDEDIIYNLDKKSLVAFKLLLLFSVVQYTYCERQLTFIFTDKE